MTNVMSFGAESKLRLPSCFVEVTDNEMEYTDGGWFLFALKILASVVVGVGSGVAAGVATSEAGAGTGWGIVAGIGVGLGAALATCFGFKLF